MAVKEDVAIIGTFGRLCDYAAAVIPEISKAVPILSRSAVGKMAANLFFSINKQPYPVKMFNEESEAKEWLKQYL